MEKQFPTEKTFRTFYIVGGVLLLISVILDAFKLSLIPVPSAFPGTVFAAICTIVSLGIATASIIIGALDRKVLGFAIRDILPRVNVLNMKLSITILFSTITWVFQASFTRLLFQGDKNKACQIILTGFFLLFF